MKTYKNLYEKYISDENILEALDGCKARTRSHDLINLMLSDSEHWIPIIRKWAENFKSAKHVPKEIYDGISRKKRIILVPTDKEQVIHHMLMNVFKPIAMQGLYEHAYGSIENRGPDLCKHYIERDIRNNREIKYFLKMDIKKYYNSIDVNILIAKLKRIIKDEKYMAVLEEVIRVQPVGLPLGFYTSQMLAQFYLKDLDRYIKESLHAHYYYRYVDDMVIHCNNKRRLHKIRKSIQEYLQTELNLKMKENFQVFRFDYIGKDQAHHGRDLDFLGYRFYCSKTTLRKKIMLKATRKAKRIKKKNRMTAYDSRQMLSYAARFDHSDTYDVYKTRIKPYVSIKRCKRKISAADKERNRRNVETNRVQC